MNIGKHDYLKDRKPTAPVPSRAAAAQVRNKDRQAKKNEEPGFAVAIFTFVCISNKEVVAEQAQKQL